ncbi:hypothetical protein BGZ58_009551 [Dissophora ornata]|nr:hypothetical protein BGZ58_009551 [Dissophora ornata]
MGSHLGRISGPSGGSMSMGGIPGMAPGMGGMGGMTNMGGLGGIGGMGGMSSMNSLHGGMGSMSKKKIKKGVVPVVKDKNCPKRPRNSDDIKKRHPEFKPTEITKMLGEEWQKLSESEKESYGSMAETDKKRYQTEMEAYDASNSGSAMPNSGVGGGGGGGQGLMDSMGWRM